MLNLTDRFHSFLILGLNGVVFLWCFSMLDYHMKTVRIPSFGDERAGLRSLEYTSFVLTIKDMILCQIFK